MIHNLSDVQSKNIGENTKIWQFCVILSGAKIGRDCNICAHCFIENDVIIGDRVTIKSGVQIWDKARIEDDVFVGPNVSFANDKYPRSKNKNANLKPIIIKKGASVGAGAVLLPGIIIGENAMIAAGSVVFENVPANSTFKNKITNLNKINFASKNEISKQNGGGGGGTPKVQPKFSFYAFKIHSFKSSKISKFSIFFKSKFQSTFFNPKSFKQNISNFAFKKCELKAA